MSKHFTCDGCEEPIQQSRNVPPVKTHGLRPVAGGRILLPDPEWEMDFCSTGCFWQWAAKLAWEMDVYSTDCFWKWAAKQLVTAKYTDETGGRIAILWTSDRALNNAD